MHSTQYTALNHMPASPLHNMTMQDPLRIGEPNPVLGLYLCREDKHLVTKRTSDDTPIASVFIRDFDQLVGAHWDTLGGRYLSLVFQDASVRLHDEFQQGKLVALVRGNGAQGKLAGPVDASCWGRVHQHGERGYHSDLTRLLPTLVKFVGGEASLEATEPFVPGGAPWRQPPSPGKESPPLLDVHVLHSAAADEVVLVLDGEYRLVLPCATPQLGVGVVRVTQPGPGLFQLWYSHGQTRCVDVRGVSGNATHMSLLESLQELRSTAQFLRHHIDTVHTKAVAPYAQWLQRVTVEAHDRGALHRDLRELLLCGTVAPELGDWLHYTVGERNLAAWGENYYRALGGTNNILLVAVVPALERLIVLGERCQGYALAHSLESEPSSIVSECQGMLGECIATMQRNTAQFEEMAVFVRWLGMHVRSECAEEYNPTAQEIQLMRDPRAAKRICSVLQQLLGEGSDPAVSIFPHAVFDTGAKAVAAELGRVCQEHVQPRLLQAVVGGPPCLELSGAALEVFPPELQPRLELLDVQWLGGYTATVYVDTANRDTAHLYVVVAKPLGTEGSPAHGSPAHALRLDFSRYGPVARPVLRAALHPAGDFPAVIATVEGPENPNPNPNGNKESTQQVHLVLHTVHSDKGVRTDGPAGNGVPELRSIEQILQ